MPDTPDTQAGRGSPTYAGHTQAVTHSDESECRQGPCEQGTSPVPIAERVEKAVADYERGEELVRHCRRLMDHQSALINRVITQLAGAMIEKQTRNAYLLNLIEQRCKRILRGRIRQNKAKLDQVLRHVHLCLLSRVSENGIALQRIQVSMLIGRVHVDDAEEIEAPIHPIGSTRYVPDIGAMSRALEGQAVIPQTLPGSAALPVNTQISVVQRIDCCPHCGHSLNECCLDRHNGIPLTMRDIDPDKDIQAAAAIDPIYAMIETDVQIGEAGSE